MASTQIVDQTCDVLIVGFGPVGAAVAALLGRYGVRTLVVEREKHVFAAPRAIALDHEALRILQMVGLSDDAFAKVTIPRVRLHSPYVGEFATIDTSGEIDTHPRLVTFYQPELERALRSAVAERPDVTVYTSVELVDLEQEVRGVRATVRSVGSDRCATVSARYVIGADGARSTVRSLIGQDPKGRSYEEEWLVVDAMGVSKPIDHVEFLCDPRRPTPHMPAPGGRTRWEFMLRPDESRELMMSDEGVRALLAPWTSSGGKELTIERKAAYRFAARSCERYRVGRVFLAGDAAHVTPPFVGQGLVSGLRDAANLSWKLAWVLTGRTSSAILNSYDQERRPHAAKMIALARAMGQLVMPSTPAHALILHGTIKMLGHIPMFRSFLDQLGPKPRNSYPRGLFVEGKGALTRGAWFPQGLVRRAAGTLERSDDVLGSGFALVGLGVDLTPSLDAPTARAWAAAGGTIIALSAGSHTGQGAVAAQALDERWLPRKAWGVVVRPDRTILHDGPAEAGNRIVHEALERIGANLARRAGEAQ